MSWTADQKQAVADLWKEGLSAAEIAKRVGRTRNAVIGIVHRLKLPTRGKVARETPQPVKKPAPKPKLVAKPAPQPKPKIEPICQPPASLGLPLDSLGAFQCRFAVTGDVPADQHRFCGHPTHGIGSWCAHHRRIVFAGKVSLQEAA